MSAVSPSARTASTCRRVSLAVTSAMIGSSAASVGARSSTRRKSVRKSASYGSVSAGPNRPTRSPSVSSHAASTPSSEVPLISPIARSIFSRRSLCYRRPSPSPLEGEGWGGGCNHSDYDRNDEMPSSDFLHEATERGFVFQMTDADGLGAAMRAGIVSGYIGFDCTADSLHVGSLVQIMLLRLLQRHGHRPVVLMGGGTTRIGDPSGKDESRMLLTDAQI